MRGELKKICNRYATILDKIVPGISNHPMKGNIESGEISTSKTSFIHLQIMLEKIPDLPPYKANRWLGYVQGVLAGYGVVDVDEERDFTRPFLSKFDD